MMNKQGSEKVYTQQLKEEYIVRLKLSIRTGQAHRLQWGIGGGGKIRNLVTSPHYFMSNKCILIFLLLIIYYKYC